jgi:hypothetical protein
MLSSSTKLHCMKRKPLALKELEKTWWWRREEIIQNGVPGVSWKVVKDAARNYELMRRAPDAILPFSKQSYLDLSGGLQMLVHRLWVKWKDPYRYVTRSRDFEEIGWTPIYADHHMQWNLRLPDNVLALEFVSHIRNLRGAQNIQIGHSLKGKANRGGSWNYIELLDREKNADKTPFNGSERHMLTRARSMATKYAKEFNEAVEKWKSKPADPLMSALASLSQTAGSEQTLEQILTGLGRPAPQ